MKKIFLILSFLCLSNILYATEHIKISEYINYQNQQFLNFNQTGSGGAFYIYETGYLTLSSNTFTNNIATESGGAIYNKGTLCTTNNLLSRFLGNYSFLGGAIHNESNGEVNIYGDFYYNKAVLGGAIFNLNSFTTSSDCGFFENEACSGGAIVNLSNFVIDKKSVFGYNKSTATAEGLNNLNMNIDVRGGGAIWNGGTLLIKNEVQFSSNSSLYLSGGAIKNKGIIAIYEDALFNNNTAFVGGAIDNEGNISISKNSIFLENISGLGGAIYNSSYTAKVWINENAEFAANEAMLGGAIANIGNIYISSSCKFMFNHATVSGGAIYNTDNAFVSISSNNILHGNISEKSGGAIFNTGTVIITSSTFEVNLSYQNGGAIYTEFKGITSIGEQSKFVGNTVFVGNEDSTYNGCGGAIFNNGTTEIRRGSLFQINISSNAGGAIYNVTESTVAIDNNISFQLNNATNYGGAIYNEGVIIFSKSTTELFGQNYFESNNSQNGGAIYNTGFINIENNVVFSNNQTNFLGKGGAIYNTSSGTIEILNGATFTDNSATLGGAIYNEGFLLLVSNNNTRIEFTNNKNNGISNAIYDKGGVIALNAGGQPIIFNDRIISENDTSILNINKTQSILQTTGIIFLNEDMTGFTGQINLYDGTVVIGEKGTWFCGNTFIKNATINMINKKIQEHNFKQLQIEDKLNLVVDADLLNKKMDTISADSFNGTGKINVSAINILNDNNEKETTEILFTSSIVLKDKITSVNTVSSKLYKYDIVYDNGYFNFTNVGKNINPIVLEASIANSVGGFVTQTTILNQAFASMENIKSRILQVKNEIPVDSPLYASRANTIFFQKTNRIESGLWLRPFYSQETINLDNLSVDNTLTGTLAGLDLATGENSLVSLYLGYAGSEQKYENIKVSQTGYILGVTGMLVKEQWYAGLTANINFNKAESQSSYGTDNFDMNMYSVGAKAGYNFDLSDKWKLEPNLMLMYGNVNSQEYQTKQGAKVEGQSIANIIFEPQIKAKLNLENGWQPYGLIGYVVNAGDKVTTKVEEVEFDGQKIGNYVEFGAGVDKSFKNSPWSLYIQLTGRSGDRTGFDGNFGIKYSFLTAKEKRKIAKIKKIQEKRKAKQEYLKQRRKREIEE